MAETDFEVLYEGPALTDNRMDVRYLAPALLALGGLVSDLNEIVNPDQPPVSLQIRAVNRGSFVVNIDVVQTAATAMALFSSDPVTAMANLKTLLIDPSMGVLGFTKRLRGRRIVHETPDMPPQEPQGSVDVTLDDNTHLTIPVSVLQAYKRVSVRKQSREVLRPLEDDGIETVTLRDEQVALQIDEADLAGFDVGDRVVIDSTTVDLTLEILSPSFVAGNKWRFSDGGSFFWATMSDPAFWQQVESSQEGFHKGDTLRCRVRMEQYRKDEGGLALDRTVERVLEHSPAGIPTELSIDSDASAGGSDEEQGEHRRS